MNASDRDADRAELFGYLERLAANGGTVPCRSAFADDAAAWTSSDPLEQSRAAVLCVGCAGVKACDAYGLRWPKEAGVYGGRTESERQRAATPEEAA